MRAVWGSVFLRYTLYYSVTFTQGFTMVMMLIYMFIGMG